jgi:ribonuclease BN (tRNA processing enzyme)
MNMQIGILGTRGEVSYRSPKHSKHSGVLIGLKLMFDLGEREFVKLNPQAIFITHLHPDHAFLFAKIIKLICPFSHRSRRNIFGLKSLINQLKLGNLRLPQFQQSTALRLNRALT